MYRKFLYFSVLVSVSVIFTGKAWATPLNNGGSIDETISSPGDIDTHTFSANIGESVLLRIADTESTDQVPADFSPRIDLFAPNGTFLTGSGGPLVGDILRFNLPTTGTYTVQVSDSSPGNNATGSYRLHLVKIAGASENEGGVLQNGSSVDDRIDLGDLDSYTFSANIGESVLLRVADTESSDLFPADFSPRIDLFAPNGSSLTGSSGQLVGDIFRRNLPSTGTYTVVVSDASPGEDAAGDYRLHLAKMAGAAENEGGVLQNGSSVDDRIDLGDLDSYTFTANIGESVLLRVADTESTDLFPADFSPRIDLFAPSGSFLTGTSGQLVGDIFRVNLPSTGIYTVVVSDASAGEDAAGNYRLHLAKMAGAAENEGGTLINGLSVSDDISLGDLDSYTFSANTGESVLLRAADTESTDLFPADFTPRIDLFAPNGSFLTGSSGPLVADVFRVNLPSSGTYTVVVSDASAGEDAAGSYDLYLAKAPGANEENGISGGDTVVEFIDLGDLDSYAFEPNVVGTNVVVTVTDPDDVDFTPRIDLFRPSGAFQTGRSGALQAEISVNLAEAGPYTLVVSDASAGEDVVGNYELSVAGNVSAVRGGPVIPVVLDNPNPQTGDRLGFSTAIDGDYAAIGIRLDNAGGLVNSGSVEIYRLVSGNWIPSQTLTSSDPGAQHRFGHSVGLSGNWLVVGEENNNTAGFRSGAVHLLERTGSTFESRNVLFGVDARDFFGRSVAVDGNSMVIGALNADDNGTNSGAAEVVDFNSAGAVLGIFPLVPTDIAARDNFGNAVSISGDYAVVGAFRDDDNANSTGSAYIFFRNQGGPNAWGQVAKLLATNPAANDQFGFSVSISDDTAAIGSRFSDSASADQIGAVYVFRGFDSNSNGILNDWSDVTLLTATDAVAGDRLGTSVAVDGDRLLTGAPFRDEFGENSGIVYFFKRSATGFWSQDARLFDEDTTDTRDEFGISVSLDNANRNGIVGSWLDNVPGANNSGRGYIFELF